jgi:hypothetical protein
MAALTFRGCAPRRAPAFLAQRHPDRNADEGGDHGQREADRDLVEVDQQHLDADEHQHRGQAVLEQREAVGHVGQQEVHRAQAEDGEDVRGQHDEGIRGDGEDGRDRIDGEDQVRDLDQDQRRNRGVA